MKKLLLNTMAIVCFTGLGDCYASTKDEKPLNDDLDKKQSGSNSPSSTYGSRSGSPLKLSESELPDFISSTRMPLRNKDYDVLFLKSGPLQKINPTLLMPTGDEWGTIITKGSQGINDINMTDQKQIALDEKLASLERKIKQNEQRMKDHNEFIEQIRDDHFSGNKYPTSIQITNFKKPLEEKLSKVAVSKSNEDYIRNPNAEIVDLQRQLLLININPTDLQSKINKLLHEKGQIEQELENLGKIKASKEEAFTTFNLLFEVSHKTNVNLKQIGWPDDELFTTDWFHNTIINMGYPAALIDSENIELFTTAIPKFGPPLVLLPVNSEEEMEYSPFEVLTYLKHKVAERKKVVSLRLAYSEEATSGLLLYMHRKKISLNIQQVLPTIYQPNQEQSLSGKGQPVQFTDFLQNKFLSSRKEVTQEMRNGFMDYTNLNAANLIAGAIIDSPGASAKEGLRRLPGDVGRDFILANFRKGQSSQSHIPQVHKYLLEGINEILFDTIDLKRLEFIENRLTTIMTPKSVKKNKKYVTSLSIKLLSSSSTSSTSTLNREDIDD